LLFPSQEVEQKVEEEQNKKGGIVGEKTRGRRRRKGRGREKERTGKLKL
jgi:hypothetical protein